MINGLVDLLDSRLEFFGCQFVVPGKASLERILASCSAVELMSFAILIVGLMFAAFLCLYVYECIQSFLEATPR